jgi:hypothetical protein
LEGPAAVVSKVTASTSTSIIATAGNAIRQSKVNIARLPCVDIRCQCSGRKVEEEDCQGAG